MNCLIKPKEIVLSEYSYSDFNGKVLNVMLKM